MKHFIALTLVASLSTMANAKSDANVYSPEAGVICDKKSGFCSDSYGISLGMTKDFLGQKAADKLMKILSDKNFDATFYTMMNGLTCDTKKKICKKSKWDEKADAHWTAILFGKKAAHGNGNGGANLVQAAKDCKLYLSNEFSLPLGAFSVKKGHRKNGKIIVPVLIEWWDNDGLNQRGKCKIHNGNITWHKNK